MADTWLRNVKPYDHSDMMEQGKGQLQVAAHLVDDLEMQVERDRLLHIMGSTRVRHIAETVK